MTNRTISPLPENLPKVIAIRGITCLREEPFEFSTIETHVLYGELLAVHARVGEWLEASIEFSGFCHRGFVLAREVAETEIKPTHQSNGRLATIHLKPGLKSPTIDHLSRNSILRIVDEHSEYYKLWPIGWIFKHHTVSLGPSRLHYVSEIENFAGAPYIWGGRSALGMDCSGMIQYGLSLCGLKSPRAMNDMAEYLGNQIPQNSKICQGDFFFYPTHCGIFLDSNRVIHSDGRVGAVIIEQHSILHQKMLQENDANKAVTYRRL